MHTQAMAGLRRAALLLALVLLPTQLETTAHAAATYAERTADNIDAMRVDMHTYFDGEKTGGIWLMSIGAPAVVTGAGLLFHPDELPRGIGYPMLILGAAEFVGGLLFYLNTNRRVPRFDRELGTRPAAFASTELTRLRRVNRELSFLTAVELTLMVAGGTMAGVGALRGLDTLSGIGTGILIHSTVLFLYDQFAARRALRYTDNLLRFNAELITAPALSGSTSFVPRGAALTLIGQF